MLITDGQAVIFFKICYLQNDNNMMEVDMNSEARDVLTKSLAEYQTKKRKLVSTIQEGYIGKNTYEVMLENGATMVSDQITKRNVHGNASVVLAITHDHKFLLVVQSRPNTKETVAIEFPAGMADEKELGESTAVRELMEETGYLPETILKLEEHYQDQGCSGAVITTYLAEGCKKVLEPKLDADENLSYVLLTKRDIEELMFGRRTIPTRVRQFLEDALYVFLSRHPQLFARERKKLELRKRQDMLIREIGIRDANSKIAYLSYKLERKIFF